MPEPSRAGSAAIFLNRAAASADSHGVRLVVDAARRALDADLHVVSTRDASELAEWMEERAGGYATVVVAGGDGSLGIAYNVLAGVGGVVLGYIPAGFGNATARLLDLPPDPHQLAALLAHGEARPVDLVDADGRLALFAGAGWDALVAERYARGGARRIFGWAAAISSSTADLLRRVPVAVLADDHLVHSGPMELLVVSTTPWYGRGLWVNPGARPDQGRLSLRVYRGPFPAFAAETVRWLVHRQPAATRVDAQRVVLRRLDGEPLPIQADGDLIGRRVEWTLALRPRAVRLIGRW